MKQGTGTAFCILYVLLFNIVAIHAEHQYQEDHISTRTKRGIRVKTGSCGYTGFLGNVLRDVLDIHRNLFSATSYKIIASTFPAYIAARMADDRIQSHFYCPEHHKNRHQMPEWCSTAAKWSIGIPIVGLGSLAFLSPDEDMRLTSRIFLTGMPFVVFGKDVLKKIKINACLRPKCEFFCPHKHTYGGCPSGHMAEATYMMILYGIRYGPAFAIPLAGIATFVAATFITCNRHYTSQIIAGAALGAAYACAAHKLISCQLKHQLEFNITFDTQGKPGFYLCYRF